MPITIQLNEVNSKASYDQCCVVCSMVIETPKHQLNLDLVCVYVCGFTQDFSEVQFPEDYEPNFPEDAIILPIVSGGPTADREEQDFLDMLVNAIYPALVVWKAAGGESVPLPFTYVQPDDEVRDSPEVPF